MVGVAGLMTSCFSSFFPRRLGDVMAAEGLSRVEALGAVTLGIVSFPFDVFFPLVARVETHGGTASLAFPPSFAASQGGMMSEINRLWERVTCGCVCVLVMDLAACVCS